VAGDGAFEGLGYGVCLDGRRFGACAPCSLERGMRDRHTVSFYSAPVCNDVGGLYMRSPLDVQEYAGKNVTHYVSPGFSIFQATDFP
jgi:hypothetical protein